ncbi:hypothetical protein ACSQ67_007672 [Phaseolus vulgaris]
MHGMGAAVRGSSEARYLVNDDEDVVESVFSDIGGEDDGAKGNLVLLEDPELVDFSSKVGVDLKEGVMPALGSQNNEWERLGSQNRAWERMEMGDTFKGVQIHVSGGVNEDPSADVADHVGFPATCDFGVGGEVYPSGVALGGTPAGDDAAAAPVYRDEGLEVTDGRGLGYDEHLGGSPAVEGLSEAADGGEVDDANRSVGKESVGAVEMVFSAETTCGKRLGKTFSKTNLKNMRRKVAWWVKG